VSRPRFYLDENVPVAVEAQLATHGVDVVSARTVAALGEPDPDHLRRAASLGRVLCTHDQDFLRLAAQGVEHAGIVFARVRTFGIGQWVRALLRLHQQAEADSLRGRVVFLG
jgi:predicted nuclease of predicted toxin-antitoxin system